MTDSENRSALSPELDTIEARVLACLIEKESTTPDQYPLTANAVQVACNQKTAREPLLDLEPGAVGHALRTLEDKRLVRVIHGSRALRYDHRTDDVYAISPEQRALLALLVLRGPQTAGELFARSERMYRYPDVEHVRSLLDRLATRQPAMVVRLSRGGGQREDRYAHLLSGPVDQSVTLPQTSPVASSRPSTVEAAAAQSLAHRVDDLEQAMRELRAELEELRHERRRNS